MIRVTTCTVCVCAVCKLPVCCCTVAEVKINISEGVKFAQDICNGMAYLHSMETLITRFDLNPHHVFVSYCSLFSTSSGVTSELRPSTSVCA